MSETRRYLASIEVVVEVPAASADPEIREAQALEAIGRTVIAPMPLSVVGAWVSYVEEDRE